MQLQHELILGNRRSFHGGTVDTFALSMALLQLIAAVTALPFFVSGLARGKQAAKDKAGSFAHPRFILGQSLLGLFFLATLVKYLHQFPSEWLVPATSGACIVVFLFSHALCYRKLYQRLSQTEDPSGV